MDVFFSPVKSIVLSFLCRELLKLKMRRMFHSRDVGEQIEAEYVANGWKMEGGSCRVWADKKTPQLGGDGEEIFIR